MPIFIQFGYYLGLLCIFEIILGVFFQNFFVPLGIIFFTPEYILE